jgi:hypothetical protein
VSCNNPKDDKFWFENWTFYHNNLDQGYLKSNDIISLSIKKSTQKNEFLRSHDIQFSIEDDIFQEVVSHNERLGINDDVSKHVLSEFYSYCLLNFFFSFPVVY